MNSNFPTCKECGVELFNGLDMGKELCGQCWFDSFSFDTWDKAREEE